MNQVHLIGRITKDIDLKKTQSGISVANFTLAINRPKQKDKEQESDFISCIAWRSTADVLKNYTSKGSKIAVNGRIQTRNYEDKDGKRIYVTEVVCDSVQLLEKNNIQNEPEKHSSTNLNNFECDHFSNDVDYGISSDDLPF